MKITLKELEIDTTSSRQPKSLPMQQPQLDPSHMLMEILANTRKQARWAKINALMKLVGLVITIFGGAVGITIYLPKLLMA